MSRLLETLGQTARTASRKVWNDPEAAEHVESCVMPWLLDWDCDREWSVRAYIARRSLAETRRLHKLVRSGRRPGGQIIE